MNELTDDEIRAMVNMAALQDVVLRAFVAVVVSGREVTSDTVWAAAAFTMPPGVPQAHADHVRESIDGIFEMARSLSPSRTSRPEKST